MDYALGKIYKVVCTETKQVYVGSTIRTLVSRLYDHKSKTSTCSSRVFINPEIVLIEDYPCDTKEDLLWRERYWIENMDCINQQNPITSNEERKEQMKQYDINNAEKIKQRKKHYYIKNKETKSQKHKEYYIKNKETTLQRHKEHYIKNKETILQKQKERITCECGAIISRGNKSSHKKSKKHISIIAELKQ